MRTTKSLGLNLFEGKDKLSFTRINENAEKLDALSAGEVGTVKTTVRSDLGAKWLLCDGAFVSADEYPDLTQVLPETAEIKKVKNEIGYTAGGWAALYTGRNLVMFTRTADGASSLVAGAPMAENGITGKTTMDYVYCSARSTIATNGNGVCVAAGYYDATLDQRYLYVTTDHGDTWTKVVPTSTSAADGTEVLGVAYHDGIWAAVFQSDEYFYVLKSVASQPVNKTDWTTELITVPSASGRSFSGLHYFNGYWCSIANGAVLKSADLITWRVTVVDGLTVSPAPGSVANGVYFTGGGLYSTDLADWYKLASENGNTLYSVAYAHGWYISHDAHGRFYRAKSPSDVWEEFAGFVPAAGETHYDSALLAVGDHFVLVDQYAARQNYGRCFEVKLPNVSVSNDTYAFIKAVE